MWQVAQAQRSLCRTGLAAALPPASCHSPGPALPSAGKAHTLPPFTRQSAACRSQAPPPPASAQAQPPWVRLHGPCAPLQTAARPGGEVFLFWGGMPVLAMAGIHAGLGWLHDGHAGLRFALHSQPASPTHAHLRARSQAVSVYVHTPVLLMCHQPRGALLQDLCASRMAWAAAACSAWAACMG